MMIIIYFMLCFGAAVAAWIWHEDSPFVERVLMTIFTFTGFPFMIGFFVFIHMMGVVNKKE